MTMPASWLPFELATEAGVLAFFSTITVFGTPIDVTLAELALECCSPADAATAEIFAARCEGTTLGVDARNHLGSCSQTAPFPAQIS